jgi:hypothetical protein
MPTRGHPRLASSHFSSRCPSWTPLLPYSLCCCKSCPVLFEPEMTRRPSIKNKCFCIPRERERQRRGFLSRLHDIFFKSARFPQIPQIRRIALQLFHGINPPYSVSATAPFAQHLARVSSTLTCCSCRYSCLWAPVAGILDPASLQKSTRKSRCFIAPFARANGTPPARRERQAALTERMWQRAKKTHSLP